MSAANDQFFSPDVEFYQQPFDDHANEWKKH
jgi:hypothetical protein